MPIPSLFWFGQVSHLKFLRGKMITSLMQRQKQLCQAGYEMQTKGEGVSKSQYKYLVYLAVVSFLSRTFSQQTPASLSRQ